MRDMSLLPGGLVESNPSSSLPYCRQNYRRYELIGRATVREPSWMQTKLVRSREFITTALILSFIHFAASAYRVWDNLECLQTSVDSESFGEFFV